MKLDMNEKSIKRSLLPLLVLSIIISLLFAGCGSSQTAQVGNASDFFEKARNEISSSDSFRMTGKMLMEYTDSSGSRDMRINYDMMYEKQGAGFLVKMAMEGPTDASALPGSSGQKIETYMSQDKMYLRYPATGQWYCKEFNLGFDITSIDQGFSPQAVVKMLNAAKSIEVEEETDSYTKYLLILDPDKLMAEFDLDAYLESMKKSGLVSFDEAQFRQMLSDFYSIMQIRLTVDKKSGYPTEFDMTIDQDILQYLRNYINGSNMPQEATMTMSMEMTISDLGKAFHLQLPQEALQARPWEELNQSSAI
jgi:Family of unknown function (DUF6612)